MEEAGHCLALGHCFTGLEAHLSFREHYLGIEISAVDWKGTS